MQFGFIIDNRKCIGCHACTTACKSEHQVPIGVFRTWVKQVEKGKFPDTRRVFSVMRCNHCTDAPCVEICPVQALYIRPDGIVDFDNNRCIGCKSCMQACPYDALYIDPETRTAAKCNYCAHRIDIGLEPACVNVCPEEAIVSGDMNNPNSKISKLLARETVTVRKASKGTQPNLFYIDGDEASLNPLATEKKTETPWSQQTRGVGHYAKATEKLSFDEGDLVNALIKSGANPSGSSNSTKQVAAIIHEANRVFDAPDKGILWGWEVSSYVWTKAIAAGAFLVPFLAWALGKGAFMSPGVWWWGLGFSLFFLIATTILLVLDLDQPNRFLYVMLRPQWRSWLVRGGYSLATFGGLLTLWGLTMWFDLKSFETPVLIATAIFGLLTSVYTAFLFAQAKGRDFWQSPVLPIHMVVHSLMAGAAILLFAGLFVGVTEQWVVFLKQLLLITLGVNLLTLLVELYSKHPTVDSAKVVQSILSGRYATMFWTGTVILGNLAPIVLLWFGGSSLWPIAGILVLAGIYITEKIWVEAPQRIPLS